MVASQPSSQQEAIAFNSSVAAYHQVVMGKVVTGLALKRQFAMMQLGIIAHRHGQARTGEMSRSTDAGIVFDDRSSCTTRNLQMVPVMQRIHFSGLLATGADMQQIERFNRVLPAARLITLVSCARLSVKCRKISGWIGSGNVSAAS
ncbi:Uncharacterised protein [Serratia fonticola]|uniref:Uncharacterized protein n=1 Tax=Serratia fonticola TaxID=47917 RepID=A0A4U9V4D9_SERFO|nr:Uncharacterised protein [Serratia fonticola]